MKRDRTKFIVVICLSVFTLMVAAFGVVDPNRQVIHSFDLEPGE